MYKLLHMEKIPCVGSKNMQSLLTGPKKGVHLASVSVSLITECE